MERQNSSKRKGEFARKISVATRNLRPPLTGAGAGVAYNLLAAGKSTESIVCGATTGAVDIALWVVEIVADATSQIKDRTSS